MKHPCGDGPWTVGWASVRTLPLWIRPCGVPLTCRAQRKQGTLQAAWLIEGAQRLPMELYQGVMFVEHSGVPGFGYKPHEALFREAGVIEPLVLPHAYSHLAPLVGVA